MSTSSPATLTRDRHAAIVEYLLRHKPGAHRVLFRPSLYIFDDRDHIRSVEIDLLATELRIRFNSETTWPGAMEIIRTLLALDAEACLMSIGTRIDGRDYYGEYAGGDLRKLEDLVAERQVWAR